MGFPDEKITGETRAVVTCWCGGHWVWIPNLKIPVYGRPTAGVRTSAHITTTRGLCLIASVAQRATIAAIPNDFVRRNYFGSASRHSATTPEPSVEPPAATAKSMFSAKVDICTNAKRCRLSLATGINRINLTVPNWAHFALKIDSSSGSGSRISTFNKGTLR